LKSKAVSQQQSVLNIKFHKTKEHAVDYWFKINGNKSSCNKMSESQIPQLMSLVCNHPEQG